MLEHFEDRPMILPSLALIHTGLLEWDEAMNCIEECWAARSPLVLRLKTDPRFAPLRSHPRFQAILAEVGLS